MGCGAGFKSSQYFTFSSPPLFMKWEPRWRTSLGCPWSHHWDATCSIVGKAGMDFTWFCHGFAWFSFLMMCHFEICYGPRIGWKILVRIPYPNNSLSKHWDFLGSLSQDAHHLLEYWSLLTFRWNPAKKKAIVLVSTAVDFRCLALTKLYQNLEGRGFGSERKSIHQNPYHMPFCVFVQAEQQGDARATWWDVRQGSLSAMIIWTIACVTSDYWLWVVTLVRMTRSVICI